MSSILIVGSYGTFSCELINRLYKEKWRVFTLTSNKKAKKPAHVFEQYTFHYDSDSVNEVITSCHPEIIIFTGAYDPLYKWDEENVKAEALNYITGLSNLIMNASMNEVRQFIYVSSHRVFEEEYVVDINENMPCAPKGFKSMTISQGENMVMHFNQTSQMEATVIRIAHMYGIPLNREACNDIYSSMCRKALITGRLTVNSKKVLSALYVKDAAEAIYQMLKAPERKFPLYHISSMEETTEDEVAQLIRENIAQPVDIIDNTVGLKHRFILSNERFCKEFDFQSRYSCKEIIPEIISYMKNHKYQFLNREEKYEGNRLKNRLLQLFRKLIPFLECIIFFIPFFMLNNRAAGSTYFSSTNTYLLFVLLFAIVHGRQQAIFASLLSVLGYAFRQMYTASGFSLLININTYIWIAQIFIVGLTVGHLKDRFREMETDKNEKIDFLTERLNDITSINSSNTKMKNYFAEKLISSTESIGRIYSITSKLDRAANGEVLFAALDTLSEIMMIKDLSIYLMSNSRYCRMASSSSEKARSLGKSISTEEYRMIFDVLESRQVYINRSLDKTLPMMASALYDSAEHMRIVVFLWDIPYENMTLYHANLLTVVGALIYSAAVRDADYLEALAYRRFLPGTTILQESAFKDMVNIYKHAQEKGYAESCIIYFQNDTQAVKLMDERIQPLLRDTDYVGIQADGNLAILLTNTSEKECVYVRNRLEANKIHTHFNEKYSLPDGS